MKRNLLKILGFLLLISCSKGELIDYEKSQSYFRKNSSVYYSSNGNWIAFGYKKSNADLKTFKILTNHIGKDNSSIYFRGNKQVQIDYSTFRIDFNGIPKDKNNVYEYGIEYLKPVEINDIDVETFEYLQENKSSQYSWTKDKNNYYFNGTKLNVDYKSLKFLNDDFFYDKEYLYSDLNDWKIITISKIENPPKRINKKYILSKDTFYYVGRNDKNRISLISKNIKNYRKVNSISENVILVDTIIYTYGTVYEPLNPETFEKVRLNANTFKTISKSEFQTELGVNFYKDKNNVYFNNFLIKGANPESFKVLTLGFSKDNKSVFHNSKELKGVDSKTFRKVKDKLIWKDNLGNEYNYLGEKIKKL